MGANVRKNVMRRQARLRREGKAVSPVVATLILILIAVAAAAALYLWLVAWQGGVTGSIGSPSAQYTVTIGGSTSVYPFTQAAATQFEQNNTNIVLSVNQGGTTAGVLAVCHNDVDIGESSSLQTVSGLQTSDGCPATTVITTVAYDAVDMIVPTSNPHGLLSINYDTVAYIYAAQSVGSTPTLAPTTIDGGVTPQPVLLSSIAAGKLAWDQIPAAVNGAALSISIGGAAPVPITQGVDSKGIGAGTTCGPSTTVQSDICDTGGATATSGTPCGFLVCAGGATSGTAVATATIDTVARSDGSGTTQSFEARILGATSSTGFATSTAALGFSGCGGNNIIADCGYTAIKTGEGNPGVITATGGDLNSIGYASDGLARATGSGVGIVAFNGVGQSAGAGTGYAYGGVLPSTGSTGTIAVGIILGGGAPGATTTGTVQYVGWRPFEMITTNQPTGEVQRFIQWVLDPANNQNIATETQEVSIYSI